MATERPLESQVRDQLQYSLLNQNDLRIVPYVEVNGEWTIPDGFVLEFALLMAQERVFQRVFYDGSVKSPEEFLGLMKKPANVPVFFFEEEEPLGVAWLNGLNGNVAFAHFGGLRSARGLTDQLGAMALRYWMAFNREDGSPLLSVILGLTPRNNPLALRFIERIGFTVLGDVPNILYDAYRGEHTNAVLSFYAR